MDIQSYFKFWTTFSGTKERVFTKRHESIFTIPYAELSGQGVKLLIFDVDDTLTGHHGELSSKTIDFLRGLTDSFKVAFLTNRTSRKRKELSHLTHTLGIHIEPCSKKPSAHSFIDILRRFNLQAKQAAMVGDRVGMDMWGAFNAGISLRILVHPFSKLFIGKKAPAGIRFLRWLEKRYAEVIFNS